MINSNKHLDWMRRTRLTNVCSYVSTRTLIPILHQKAKRGTPHQAKQAVHCIHAIFNNKEVQLAQIFEVGDHFLTYWLAGMQYVSQIMFLLNLTCVVHHLLVSRFCTLYVFFSWIDISHAVFYFTPSLCHVVWTQTSQSSSSLPSCPWATSPCWPQISLLHQWSPLWLTSLSRTCSWMTGCVEVKPFYSYFSIFTTMSWKSVYIYSNLQQIY